MVTLLRSWLSKTLSINIVLYSSPFLLVTNENVTTTENKVKVSASTRVPSLGVIENPSKMFHWFGTNTYMVMEWILESDTTLMKALLLIIVRFLIWYDQ